MPLRNMSRWVWLGIIIDVPIIVYYSWWDATYVVPLLPFRSIADWGADPMAIIAIAFRCLGLVAILMAIRGERIPLFAWNISYLLMLCGILWTFDASLIDTFIRVLIPLIVLAATSTYVGHRRMLGKLANSGGATPVGAS